MTRVLAGNYMEFRNRVFRWALRVRLAQLRKLLLGRNEISSLGLVYEPERMAEYGFQV